MDCYFSLLIMGNTLPDEQEKNYDMIYTFTTKIKQNLLRQGAKIKKTTETTISRTNDVRDREMKNIS